MAKIIFKQGTEAELKTTPLQDGMLSFTTDDGKIHLDYTDENHTVQRKTFYGGILKFGTHVYDGSKNVTVEIYDGEVQ